MLLEMTRTTNGSKAAAVDSDGDDYGNDKSGATVKSG
jgi:hypothetical protein